MAAADLQGSPCRDRTLLDLRGARATVRPKGTDLLDRPALQSAIIAEPSSVRSANAVLTDGALEFLAELHERFDSRRRALVDRRKDRQQRFDSGELPDFREDTR